jgi:hypothetical protein
MFRSMFRFRRLVRLLQMCCCVLYVLVQDMVVVVEDDWLLQDFRAWYRYNAGVERRRGVHKRV